MCNGMGNDNFDNSCMFSSRTTLKTQPYRCIFKKMLDCNNCSFSHSKWFNFCFVTIFHLDTTTILSIRPRGYCKFGDHSNTCKSFTSESKRIDLIEVFGRFHLGCCMTIQRKYQVILMYSSPIVFDLNLIETTSFDNDMNRCRPCIK